jgi:hypothetical protein
MENEKAERQLRNVSENPCNMCMPLGGIIAFKGIEGTMTLLHGSQGCATYMRRTISEHYNEPSMSLHPPSVKKGTVFGGEENLKKESGEWSVCFMNQDDWNSNHMSGRNHRGRYRADFQGIHSAKTKL